MRADVVAAARGWLGTPYVHQASQRGVGTDCLGLIRGVWRDIGAHEPDAPPPYTPDWGELGGDELLLQAAMRHLVCKTNMTAGCGDETRASHEAPGDVLVFRMRTGAIAKHLGIQLTTGAGASFIHAYDRHGVVESPLTQPWRTKIAGRFAFPRL